MAAEMLGIWYLLFTRPSPLISLLDFYVFGPIGNLTAKRYKSEEFVLRNALGGGNFGVTYEAVQGRDGETTERGPLSEAAKKRRVVLKRVNADQNGASRRNFLKGGTIARGAEESGDAEDYMNSRVMRRPGMDSYVAKYRGSFVSDRTVNGITAGKKFLVWKFESDCTLLDAASGKLGKFPADLAPVMLGARRSERLDDEKRDAATVRLIMKKLLTALDRLHGMGIVHRDVKPDNILITSEGAVKLIDFGAAADMSTGVNFNPEFGMLDPRYAPPEELIMPKDFPRAPNPLVAAILSPCAWQYGRPDLFDSYSAGMILLQLAIPQLRPANVQKNLKNDLAQYDFNINAWRNQSARARNYDFSLLDRNNRAGWDLANRLMAMRNDTNRGRYSVSQALRHRYFIAPDL